MKKRICLTVDEDVLSGLKQIPRGVSISEVVNWVLKAMIEDVKPNGMSEKEFLKYMDNDPRGREVRAYLQDKLGHIVEKGKVVKHKLRRGK